ncbi:pilus assembly protein TadG-related protein [Acidicapsa dinghuensis]|uniref:Pilus assembly protein TadG-related protein n=1 Tax=Acidicapsa dinghuensis TaxID=2218256 RepID=A0ABW1ECD3_9BACT|nr:pilus assembly protein TadG-related protein [Acidicapsa dinghuensis]
MRIAQNGRESGQTLIMLALSMSVVFGFAAMAIDMGSMFRAKRNMQIAADAAATAAALDNLYNGSITSAKAAGQAAATANGVTNGSSGATVTINNPPSAGPNAGSSGYFEAIVQTSNPTFFMSYLGTKSMAVAARAVAGTPAVNDSCIYIANPTASDVFHVQGSTTISAPNCGIYINSSSTSAVKITGNASTITAGYFDDYGGNSGHQTSPTPISTNSAAQSDPFGNVTGPSLSACSGSNISTATSVTTSNASTAIPTAANGVACFSNAVTLNNGVTLPGAANGVVYVFENGLTIATGATVTIGTGTAIGSATTGATIDLYGGTLNQNSNSVLNSWAPTAGTYNGISILQPLSNTTTPLQVQFGSNNETLDGVIYAPGVEVYLQDNGGGVEATGVYANTMYIKSSTLNVPSYSAANPNTTPLRLVTLVE